MVYDQAEQDEVVQREGPNLVEGEELERPLVEGLGLELHLPRLVEGDKLLR